MPGGTNVICRTVTVSSPMTHLRDQRVTRMPTRRFSTSNGDQSFTSTSIDAYEALLLKMVEAVYTINVF
jgi:hypothetical protein